MMGKPIYLKEILSRLPLPGIWKPNLKYPYIILYHLYSVAMFVYFLVFILSQLIELYFIRDYNELIENLAVTLLCITTLGKIIVLKSEKIKLLIQEILQYERGVFSDFEEKRKPIMYTFEEDQKNIYAKHIWYFHNLNVFLNVVGVTTTFPFFVRPVIEMYLVRSNVIHNNASFISDEKPLPISTWFPFDKYEYYCICYIFQVVGIAYAASSIVFIDGFLLGLMFFITGRIRILQNKLRNLKRNAQEIVRKNRWLNENSVIEKFARECVIEHNNIIKYAKDLDNVTRFLMLLDFAICSIQIAVSGFWLIVTDISVQLGVVLIYFTAMLIQMFLFYGFANGAIYESMDVVVAIWNSEWYAYDNSIKKTLLLIMLRAQDPLKLSVGPFYTMSNQTALMILKTAYSYVAVLSKVYSHDK